MLEGSKTVLKMSQVLQKGMNLNPDEYICEVISDSLQEDYIWMRIAEEHIINISLDAKYTCVILAKDGHILCEGMIRDRYQNEDGNVIVFQIMNGFYKNLSD